MILIPDLVPFRHWVSRGVFLVVPDFCVCCVVWCGVVWCGVVWCGVVNFNRMGHQGRVDRWTPSERRGERRMGESSGFLFP
jgi:hypothetical protein